MNCSSFTILTENLKYKPPIKGIAKKGKQKGSDRMDKVNGNIVILNEKAFETFLKRNGIKYTKTETEYRTERPIKVQ